MVQGSKGKTAGRGTKGTKARYQVPERFEGGQMPLHMRLPKLRGFTNPFRVEYQVVNLDRLAALYPKGGEVTVDDLVAKGAVRDGRPVKVLGTGDIDVKVDVTVHKFSGCRQGEDRGGRRVDHDGLSSMTTGDRLLGSRSPVGVGWAFGPAHACATDR